MEKEYIKGKLYERIAYSIFLFLTLLLSVNAISVRAEGAEWYEKYVYDKNPSTKTLTLQKCIATDAEELTIPGSATIDGVTYNKVVIDNSGNGYDGFWKSDAASLKSLTIADGVKVETESLYLFRDLNMLETANINKIDTSAINSMKGWFQGCYKLRLLDLSNWDVSSVNNTEQMFFQCYKLDSIDISCFSNTELQYVKEMFASVGRDSFLQDLDMSSISFKKMNPDRKNMFKSAKIMNLYIPAENTAESIDFSGQTVAMTINRIFYAGTQEQWNSLNNTLGTDTILVCNYKKGSAPVEPVVDAPTTDNWYTQYNYILDKKNFRLFLLNYKGASASKITVHAYTKIDGVIYRTILKNENSGSLWSKASSNLKEIILEKDVILADKSDNLFGGLEALTTVNLKDLDISNVYSMQNMFSGDWSITNINLSGVNTSGSANMTGLFKECFMSYGIEHLDIRGFDMSNAVITNIFKDTVITNLYLPDNAMSNYDFSGITNLKHIYYAGTKAKWDTLTNTVPSNVQITYEFNGPIQKSINVKFSGNGGTASSSQSTVVVGGKYGTLPTATRTNYDFAGWYTAAEGGTQITSASTVELSTEHTLYAHWTKKKVAVMFDGNGGVAAENGKNVEVGETYGTLPTATRSDYTFAGWYTAAEAGTQVTSATKVNNESPHTLYAHWTKNVVKVQVTFSSNGGDSLSTNNKEVVLGETYGELPSVTRAGHNFNGWFTASSGGSQVTSSTKVTTSAAHTLYAQWTEIITNVTVSLNANGSGATVTPGNITINVGGKYGKLPTPEREDYKFMGWYTSATEGTLITETTDLISNLPHTLYAHWELEKVIVNFEANGGKVTEKEKKVTIGEPYGQLPTPSKDGFIFDGWYTNDTSGNKVTAETLVAEEVEHNLYAHWVLDTVMVSFYAYEGAAITSKEYNVGDKYGELTIPTRSGYKFVGWFTQEGDEITADSDVTGEDAITLYAHWVKTTVLVTFNGDKASVVDPKNKEVTPGGYYEELPQPKADGYQFVGWYTETSGGTKVTSATPVTKTTDHILYAHWNKIITVSFDSNGGGQSVENRPLVVGQKYGTLPTLTRENYQFAGWYTDKNAGEMITADTDVTIENSHVLYAHWIKQTIKVTFNGDKVSNVDPAYINIYYGEAYGKEQKLPNLELNGYEFKGWYTKLEGGERVTEETIVSERKDHILYAHWVKNVKVSFDGNGNGDAITSKTLSVGQKYGSLSTPSWNGYDFAGWYTGRTDGERVTADTAVTNENAHVLYAHWIKNTITVTFNGDKVTEVKPSSKEVTPGKKYGALPELSYDGYEFIGWFTKASGGEKITADTDVTANGDHTLFAQWQKEEIKVTVSFDGNGDGVENIPSDREVTVGLKYGEISLATRENYELDGWYTERTGGEKITGNTEVTIGTSHVLYAHWKRKTITVTFIGDKVTDFTPGSKSVTYGATYGELPQLKLEGYIFKGWFTEAGNEITENTTMSEKDNHYLYAHWQEEKRKVTVSFDGNGDGVNNVPDNIIVTVGSIYGEISEPTRTGYDFEGWYPDKTTGNKISANTVVSNTNSHILYAHWKKKNIKVTFISDKSTDITLSSSTVTYGDKYGDLPQPKNDEYVFLGWYTKSGSEVTADTTVTEKSDHYLYAQWKKAKVTVVFDGNGDGVSGVPDNKELTVGETYGELTKPSRSGYNFDGWYTKASGGDKITADTLVENENWHVLYAHWIKATITVRLNGDKVTDVEPITVTLNGKYIGLPTLSKDGYNFLGWYTEAVEGSKVTVDTTVTETSDHTLYAHWKALEQPVVNTITVSFDGNSESVSGIPANKPYKVGDKYGSIADPSRSGYKFDGWFTEKEAGRKISSETIVTNENSHTLYAHWTKLNITVTFIDDRQTEISPKFINATPGASYGDLGTLPELTSEGYDFMGWYTEAVGGDRITSDSTVMAKENHYLYAHWKEKSKKVTVIFDGNGDGVSNIPNNVILTVGGTYGELAIPVKDGYDFEGWYTDEDGGEPVDKDTKVTCEETHILYAHWVKKSITVTFNGDKVSNISPKNKEVISGEIYGNLPNPSLPGYIFKGWYTAGGEIITENTIVREKADHILIAQWVEKDKKVNVFFNGNADGVSDVPGSIELTVGGTYGTYAAPSRDGYKFDGWFTEKEDGEQVTKDTKVTKETSHVLYAHWTKESITVKLIGDKVSVDSITVTAGGKYTELPDTLNFSGYIFKGWYTEAVGGDKVTKDSNVLAKYDHTLFAQWVEADKKITVSFDANGDGVIELPGSMNIIVGKEYGDIAEPVRDGYKFDGWYSESDGGDKIQADTVVTNTDSHILYAHWIKNSITVSFVAGMVDDPESTTVKSGAQYGTLPNLELTGYVFKGWFTKASEGEQVTNNTIVKAKSDHILFAHWEENSVVTVSFDGNGDDVTDVPENKTLKVGDTYGKLASPKRDGYSFVGWFTEASGGEKVESSTEMNINKSHVLYAHWTKGTVIVSFNGGLVLNVTPGYIEVKPGDTYGKANTLPELKLDGYNFLGWYTEAVGGSKVTADTTVNETSDHTLFAHWKESSLIITVSFSGNGDDVTNVPDNRRVTVGLKYGDLSEPQREGFEFDGWYTEADGGDLVEADTIVLNQHSHTLYAHWKQLEKKVIVLLNANRGFVKDKVETETIELKVGDYYKGLPTPTRDNYRFDGWYTKAVGGNLITDETEVNNENVHTLYAQWYEAGKKVMVYFGANGGKVKSAGKDVEIGLKYGELPEATKEGFVFDGWYTKAEGGVKVTAETRVTQKIAHTIYAHWADVYKKVWVSFNANGGTLSPESEEFSVGLKYEGLPIPRREGYKFAGWYTNIVDGIRVTEDTEVINEEPHTLYAYWINENDIISVTFNANGGTVNVSEKTIVVGKPYGELPVPVLEGFEFAGWYTEAEEGELVTAETEVSESEAHTLFARWKVPGTDDPASGNDPDNPGGTTGSGTTDPNAGGNATDAGQTGTGTTGTEPVTAIPSVNTVIKDTGSTSYKVTSSDEAKPTVSYAGNNNTAKTVTVPKSVTIDGVAYTVTKVEANAFKNNKNVTKIIIDKNITSISKNAFKGCKKLKLIIIKTTKLTDKTVAKGAFAGVGKKVKIKVPKKKYKAYKKLFKKKGLSKKVKIIK